MSSVLVTLFLDTIAFGFCLLVFNFTLKWVVNTAKAAMNKTMPQMKVDSFVKVYYISYPSTHIIFLLEFHCITLIVFIVISLCTYCMYALYFYHKNLGKWIFLDLCVCV